MAPPFAREYQDWSSGLVAESRKYGNPTVAVNRPNAQQGVFPTRRLPANRGNDGKDRQAYHEQRAVKDNLLARGALAQPVGPGVSAEQGNLEKQHAARPHGRRAAEPGEDQLGNERLHLKQQERAQQDGDAEQHGGHARRRIGRGQRQSVGVGLSHGRGCISGYPMGAANRIFAEEFQGVFPIDRTPSKPS